MSLTIKTSSTKPDPKKTRTTPTKTTNKPEPKESGSNPYESKRASEDQHSSETGQCIHIQSLSVEDVQGELAF